MLSETEKTWLQCQQPWVFLVIADLKKQKKKRYVKKKKKVWVVMYLIICYWFLWEYLCIPCFCLIKWLSALSRWACTIHFMCVDTCMETCEHGICMFTKGICMFTKGDLHVHIYGIGMFTETGSACSQNGEVVFDCQSYVRQMLSQSVTTVQATHSYSSNGGCYPPGLAGTHPRSRHAVGWSTTSVLHSLPPSLLGLLNV